MWPWKFVLNHRFCRILGIKYLEYMWNLVETICSFSCVMSQFTLSARTDRTRGNNWKNLESSRMLWSTGCALRPSRFLIRSCGKITAGQRILTLGTLVFYTDREAQTLAENQNPHARQQVVRSRCAVAVQAPAFWTSCFYKDNHTLYCEMPRISRLRPATAVPGGYC